MTVGGGCGGGGGWSAAAVGDQPPRERSARPALRGALLHADPPAGGCHARRRSGRPRGRGPSLLPSHRAPAPGALTLWPWGSAPEPPRRPPPARTRAPTGGSREPRAPPAPTRGPARGPHPRRGQWQAGSRLARGPSEDRGAQTEGIEERPARPGRSPSPSPSPTRALPRRRAPARAHTLALCTSAPAQTVLPSASAESLGAGCHG